MCLTNASASIYPLLALRAYAMERSFRRSRRRPHLRSFTLMICLCVGNVTHILSAVYKLSPSSIMALPSEQTSYNI